MVENGFFERSLETEKQIFLILDGRNENGSHTVEFARANVGEYLITHKCRAVLFAVKLKKSFINGFARKGLAAIGKGGRADL
jgi:hypothetical protein